MLKFVHKNIKNVGLPPGTLIHTGEDRTDPIEIELIEYDKDNLRKTLITDMASLKSQRRGDSVLWINVNGVHIIRAIEEIGEIFGIHPLTLEDIVNIGQRSKIEIYDEYVFIVMKMLQFIEDKNEIASENICFVIAEDFLISFQETKGDIFDSVRDRIRKSKGRIRSSSSDYLAYALIDTMVDHYFIILEELGEKIQDLEEDILGNPTHDTLEDIHEFKREIIFFRKQIGPIREILNVFRKEGLPILRENTALYISDVYDHAIQIMDNIDSFRDILSGMLDIYLSTISNKMNEVMKLLTIISTIFIPLTFIAGIYGMNFKYMPELEWRWGYFTVWGIMLIIFGVMVWYFKKKKWF